jgi:Transposase DDE domain
MSPQQIVEGYTQRWSIETFYQDSKGHLGFNAYRMRSAEAIGKHWCLVFVAYSLLHLTCLPAVPGRTKSLIQTIGAGLVPKFWSISDVRMFINERGVRGEDQMKKTAFTEEQITYALPEASPHLH